MKRECELQLLSGRRIKVLADENPYSELSGTHAFTDREDVTGIWVDSRFFPYHGPISVWDGDRFYFQVFCK